MKQFTDVSAPHGAPMGRSSFGSPEECRDKSISLFKVRFVDGDYDDGGAYWGSPLGGPSLYCARTDDGCTYRAFVREFGRLRAQRALGIADEKLKRAY